MTPRRRPASGSVFCGSWRRAARLLVATHLPFPSVGHVAVDGDAFRWVPAIWDY